MQDWAVSRDRAAVRRHLLALLMLVETMEP
jgi:hypothetical protein